MVSLKDHPSLERNASEEVKALTPDVDRVEIEPPLHLMERMAAEHRWRLRNSAALARLNQRLSRKRGDTKSADAFGKQIDNHVRDMAEIDRMYPGARNLMVVLDKEPPKEQEF